MAGQAQRKPAKHDAIAEVLRAQIYSRELPPGARVPSENDIAKTHGVSADTARKVLAELANEGLTQASQGKATVVREFRPIRRRSIQRLSSEVWGQGVSIWDIDVPDRDLEVDDLTVVEVEPPDLVAAALDLDEGATVWRRSRRYLIDGEPAMRAISYLPAGLVAGSPITELNPGDGGIYARLADLGHKPEHFREELRTRMPTPDEVQDLRLGPGTPVILMARYAADTDGRVVEVNDMTLSGAKYILEYTFGS